jgi:hypothetical protein
VCTLFFAARTTNYRQLTASFANNAAGLFGVANVVVVLLSVRVNLHSRSHAIFARCVYLAHKALGSLTIKLTLFYFGVPVLPIFAAKHTGLQKAENDCTHTPNLILNFAVFQMDILCTLMCLDVMCPLF